MASNASVNSNETLTRSLGHIDSYDGVIAERIRAADSYLFEKDIAIE